MGWSQGWQVGLWVHAVSPVPGFKQVQDIILSSVPTVMLWTAMVLLSSYSVTLDSHDPPQFLQ